MRCVRSRGLALRQRRSTGKGGSTGLSDPLKVKIYCIDSDWLPCDASLESSRSIPSLPNFTSYPCWTHVEDNPRCCGSSVCCSWSLSECPSVFLTTETNSTTHPNKPSAAYTNCGRPSTATAWGGPYPDISHSSRRPIRSPSVWVPRSYLRYLDFAFTSFFLQPLHS